ncbi:uncharacterized protein G2W53_042105 [Senna tora]|uniref:Uncharacterized protein n=1 Tax=Senna tora TaxID=362788 RepID=A0A834ST77_9FABA|nr:uncharacterized protein G2W53_042105 [Senna tora]
MERRRKEVRSGRVIHAKKTQYEDTFR